MEEFDLQATTPIPNATLVALLGIVGATIGEIDRLPPERRTTQDVLALFLFLIQDTPGRTLPTLLLEQEQLLIRFATMIEQAAWKHHGNGDPS